MEAEEIAALEKKVKDQRHELSRLMGHYNTLRHVNLRDLQKRLEQVKAERDALITNDEGVVARLTRERDALKEMHYRNVGDIKKYDRDRGSHHCGWRVVAEGTMDRSLRIVKQVEKGEI